MNIVILTGAGISAESGIKTFRDDNGLWENHAIEDVASPEGFQRNPSMVYRFYNARREQLEKVEPNPAHLALAKLINHCQEKPHHSIQLITQNVDDLHERSGLDPQKVWHMHGELKKMRCLKTHNVFEAPQSFDGANPCPCCQEPGLLRPHIVWFGEVPFFLEESFSLLQQCDLFLSVGTSGHVYPAAQFVSMTPETCRRVEVNIADTQISQVFDEHLVGKAAAVLPSFIDDLLEKLK